jgi:8-oxo-dGTP pyrophosphatase MutT (NUDIX family)
MPTRLPQEPSPAQTEERLALTRIRHQLARYSPRVLAESVELAHAAVALILRETSGEAEVLVIWRAEQPGDPWSGHLGFPGGRVEPGDVSLDRTAVRETREELGICLDSCARFLGRLSEIRARSLSRMLPMSIIPFVCELVNPATQRLNGEVVKTRWIPLRYFLNRANRATMSHPGDPTQTVSCYPLEDRAIWGMSLAMIDELLLDVLSANP